VIGGEAVDEDLGDLTSCNHAIAGIACLSCVALQEYKLVLVGAFKSYVHKRIVPLAILMCGS